MDWCNVKVLVTGAAGFIGSHLTERLISEGADVSVFIRYNSRNDIGQLKFIEPNKLKDLKIIAGDLRDEDAVRKAVKGVDTVFHLGALIAIPYSYIHPQEVIDTNINGSLNVFLAANEFGVRRVVHTSTSEVYGTAQYVPIDEKHPLQGQSPYSASKIGADKIAESFFCSYNLPISTVRPFNTYGPRQSARAVIPTIISQALMRDTINLGSLTPLRDFTFVSDTVAGFLGIAEQEKAIGKTINIGVGAPISIGDLALKIFTLLGKKLDIQNADSRVRPGNSEVMCLHCDNTLAKSILNWSPEVNLDSGLQKTIEWIQANLNQFNPNQYAV